MTSNREFLNIAHSVFGADISIKLYTNYPLAFKNIATVFSIDNWRTSFVICFDNQDDFLNVARLYVYLRKQNINTYIYISKKIRDDNKQIINFVSKNHISFIDHFGGMYSYMLKDRINVLELMLNDLKDDNSVAYTKNTQLVCKYYFFNEQKSYTSREIAAFLKVSPSSVSRANEILFSIGILEKNGYGAGTQYVLINKKSALKKLEKFIIRPYDNSYFMAINESLFSIIKNSPLSGQSALAEYTNLMPESRIATYAIYRKEFATIYNAYLGLNIEKPTNFVLVQSYIYDPYLFSKGQVIDLFDLYATMLFDENLKDPRVKESFDMIKEKLTHE